MFNSKKRRIRNLEASFEESYKTIMELGKEIERLENSNRYYKYLDDVRKANADRVYGLNNSSKDTNATYKKEISDLCERLKEKELENNKLNQLVRLMDRDNQSLKKNLEAYLFPVAIEEYTGKEDEEMKNKKIPEPTDERKEFYDLCLPLVDYLYKHGSPHHTIIIQQDHAEMVGGEIAVPFELRD